MKKKSLLFPIIFSLALAACSKEEPEVSTAPPEAAPSPPVAIEQEPVQMPEGAELTDLQSGYDIYVARCLNCHGDVGQGMGGNPKLAGLTRPDVGARLTDYRDGKTRGAKTALMAPAAKDLTDVQIAALASYIGE